MGPAQFQQGAGEATRLLRSLSNEHRLMILCQLGDGEMQVSQLQALVGLSQSALSSTWPACATTAWWPRAGTAPPSSIASMIRRP